MKLNYKGGAGVFVLGAIVAIVLIIGAAFVMFPPSRKSLPKRIALTSPVAPKQASNVNVAYDKFDNRTMVSVGTIAADKSTTEWTLLISDGNGGFFPPRDADGAVCVRVSYEFEGHELLQQPPSFDFCFGGTRANRDDRVAILVDGTNRIAFNELAVRPFDAVSLARVKLSDVRSICVAKTVDIRIGSSEYRMRTSQQRAIAEMLNQFAAP